MIVKLLTEHHLEFLSLKGGCRGSSESTLVKMSNCWKSHAAAQLLLYHGFPLFIIYHSVSFRYLWGMQWLSGIVIDLRPRSRWFESHRRHWVVVLEQDAVILA